MSILLPADERRKLGMPARPTSVACPECGGPALAARNGDWLCVEGETVAPKPSGDSKAAAQEAEKRRVFVLTCAARGVTVGDDRLVTVGRVRAVQPTMKMPTRKSRKRRRVIERRLERGRKLLAKRTQLTPVEGPAATIRDAA